MTSTIFEEAVSYRRLALMQLRDMANGASVEDDARFVEVLRLATRLLELSETDIANALLVSRPTVNRWLNAQSDPHPAMRKPIFSWIVRQATRKLRAVDAGFREGQPADQRMPRFAAG